MIKATELRQDNFIFTPDGVVDTVTDINMDGSILSFGFGQMYDIEPIQLTEKWLLKLGFKPFNKDFVLNGIIIHTRKRGFILRKSVPIIMHVHQLQNLYFALTGEELACS